MVRGGQYDSEESFPDKRCHSRPGEMINPFTGQTTLDFWMPMHDVAPLAVAAHGQSTSVTSISAGGDDCYEHAYRASHATVSSPGNLLTLDQSFGPLQTGKLEGQGTWLGTDECLEIAGGAVYALSGDGILSRYTVGTQQYQPLVVTDTVALGHGGSALAVGDVDGSPSSLEVVAGDYGHLYQLDSTLNFMATVPLPWEFTRVRRIAIAEVFSSSPGKEIVALSLYGGIAVFQSGSLTLLAHYGEPGIQDMVITGEQVAATTDSATAITILSPRGVMAKVTLSQSGSQNPPAELHAVSPAWEGGPLDLELARMDVDGGTRKEMLVAMFGGRLLNEGIRAFDKGSLALLAEFGDDAARAFAQPLELSGRRYGDARDMASVRLKQAAGNEEDPGEYLVTLSRGRLMAFDPLGEKVADKNLSTYAPAVLGRAVAAGSLVSPRLGDQFARQVVVATDAGRLVWFYMDDLVDGLASENLPYDATDRISGTRVQDKHANEALVATWAMARDPARSTIRVLDQTGTMWDVDAAGNVAFVGELRGDTKLETSGVIDDENLGLISGPHRAMTFVGATPQGDPTSASPVWRPVTNTTFIASVLETHPWVPNPLEIVTVWNGRSWTDDYYFYQAVYDGFMIFPKGGDARSTPGGSSSEFQAFWWTGPEGAKRFSNLVQGVDADHSTSQVQSPPYSSTSKPDPNPPPPGPPPNMVDFRNLDTTFSSSDQQAVEIFTDPADGKTLLALGTPGGSVMVYDPDPMVNAILDEQGDYGHGAISIDSRTTATGVDLFVAVSRLHPSHEGAYPSGPLTHEDLIFGGVLWLRWSGGALALIQELPLRNIPCPDSRFEDGFGASGVWVGNLDPTNGKDELVVTTFAGDLFVFELDPNTIVLSAVHHERVEGALGAYGSILVEDLVGGSEPELYVAGSFGLRRWI